MRSRCSIVGVTLLVFLVDHNTFVDAFCPASPSSLVPPAQDAVLSSTRSGRTACHAFAPPPLIIGPMIKKMREDKAKNSIPMADPTEAANEAPGLRIGRNSWKWPPVWPYEDSFFQPTQQAREKEQRASMEQLASTISGISQPPVANGEVNGEDGTEKDEYNALTYWGEQQVEAKTGLDAEAAKKLSEHYGFYLRDDMSILEFGAAEESYLPVKPQRHVGVGANLALMTENPSLTERLVVDLDNVVPNRDVDDDDLRILAKEPFDAIIMANTVEYLCHPREVFRSAWYLLKPGGIMIVPFGSNGATSLNARDVQTKMWTSYNDDQHIWMTGSFFQFSAGEGWEGLRGFDISPESAKSLDDKKGPLGALTKGRDNNMFVVQAMKGYQDETINPANPEASIRSLSWMLPVMEERDKNLVVPRLARAYATAESNDVRRAIEANIQHLPKIYEALIKMDQFAFTFGMQAQIATDLVCDPRFNGSEEQLFSLREGLGLRTPGKDFWSPVGSNTAAIAVEEKISLLAYLVPCFGDSDDEEENEARRQSFVSGLQPTYELIRSKCPSMAEEDVQLLGAELLAYEVLPSDSTTGREEFALWLGELTGKELEDLLSVRKSYREIAREALKEYKQERADEEARQAELVRKMEEQKENARQERSMYFNPRTEKMEVYDNPLKKK